MKKILEQSRLWDKSQLNCGAAVLLPKIRRETRRTLGPSNISTRNSIVTLAGNIANVSTHELSRK